MDPMNIEQVKASTRIGQHLTVAFGSLGSQTAVITGFTQAGGIRVVKYRVNSLSWTKPVTIFPGSIKRILPHVFTSQEIALLLKDSS